MSLLSNGQKRYEGQTFEGLACDSSEVRAREFTECTFDKCKFQETIFKDCRFVDCTFVKCHLVLVQVGGCYFKATQFKDSNIIGVNWTASKIAKVEDAGQKGERVVRVGFLKPIDFFNCVLSHSVFIGLQLRKINMEKCIAKDVDFTGVDLTKGNFQHTDFSDSRFSNTNLTEADFRKAKNYAIDAGYNKLKKTKFELPEAMALLRGLDIILEEPPH